ncbi:hypothetical protein OsI_07195 [Oryza sativa Indica Group]|uniref:Uncharacterized protein n=1 Tax=Oryza sativa subsp. indica TaxID=39946 RepID=B8AHV5_ORYSI|nr:hypothetical protein OsI_07195 [Oryza sativa Indica Group]
MEKSHPIQLVSQNCENHQIISIWGMIGIGKTSFIRSVYESEEITSMFEQYAWFTILHSFNLHDFVTSLAQELDAHDFSLLGNGVQKSKESIKASKRRCLLVLDDVLSIEEWSLIQPHLPNETNTKIIVTTREASIAEHCSVTYKNIYKLEGLKENAALALFKNKVFVDSSNTDLDLDMSTQAKLIIKECDGHPLAITNIAGFLARKQKTPTEWKKLNDDFSSRSYLKIQGRKVSSNNEGTIRHLSIIDVCETNKNALKQCADLTHVRSVTVFGEWRSSLDFSMMRMLRILDLKGTSGLKDDDLDQIGNFLHLSYLSLRGCADIYKLPNSLGNLWDIQVLDVSGTRIIKLPKTITKLKKLQFLCAGNVPKDDATSSIELKESSDLSKMVHEAIDDIEMPDFVAKSVQLGTTALDMTAAYCKQKMQNTDNVKMRDIYHEYCKVKFPSILHGLDMYGVEAPEGIDQLNDLHTLGVVNVAAEKAILHDLEKLKKLHKLGLTGVNKKNSQDVLSTIANLVLLHSLSLRSEGEPGLQGCLDHTFTPPSKLQSLKIYGNLVTLPTWITQIQNVTKLKLRST